MKRGEVIAKIEELTERVAASAGLEVVEVELKGAGKHQTLKVFIDKPEGVTHADCELVSRGLGDLLDADDPIAGTYDLQVSSPGVERALKKWRDWERFRGQKVKVVLRDPLPDGAKHFDGVISETAAENGQSVTVGLADGSLVTFPFDQVSRANLKFEW